MNTVYDNIPQELQNLPNWVCFRLEQRNGKATKVPYSTKGNKAKTNDSTTWANFQEVKQAMIDNKFDFTGIGFVFTGTEYMGIDIDHCLNDGEANEVAIAVITAANSYTEVSPSGTGIHIILKGKLPEGKRKNSSNGVEMYDTGRFFTITGNLYRAELKNVCNEQDVINQIHAKYVANTDTVNTAANPQPTLLTDTEIIERISSGNGGTKGNGRGQQLADYWLGNYQAYTNDESSADISLCNALAFWTRSNACQMDRLFRKSGLFNNPGRATKWDTKHSSDGRTYGQMTIDEAIKSTVAVYDNRHKTGRINGEDKVKMIFPVVDDNGKPIKQHWENTQYILNCSGVYVRENAITHRMDFFDSKGKLMNVPSVDTFTKRFVDDAAVCKLNVSYDDAIRNLAIIAEDNIYNPMADYLQQCYSQWDGKEVYITKFCEALVLTNEAAANKAFYHLLIRKYLLQCVNLWLNNGGIKPVGMLILQGRQGIGKSRAVKWLLSDLPKLLLSEQSLDVASKDNLIKCTSYALVEVSEFARSLRDLDATKQFITSEEDTFRPPYGRTSKTYPRRTSLLGTVNDAAFLCDNTGNRRFWIIPIRTIQWGELNSLPVAQLWGEAYHKAFVLKTNYWLDNAETSMLNTLNKNFSIISTTQQTLYDLLDWSAPAEKWVEHTPTSVATLVYGESGQAAKVGKELKAMAEAEEIELAGKNRSGSRFYKLPPVKGQTC